MELETASSVFGQLRIGAKATQITCESESTIRRTLTNIQADALVQYEKSAKPRRYTLGEWATLKHMQDKVTITYRSWKRKWDLEAVTIHGS